VQGEHVRLLEALIAQLEAIIPKLERDPRSTAKDRVTFALVLRIA
jgi:hypothetical protein